MLKWFNEHGFKYVLLIVVLLLIYVYHDNIKAFLKPAPAPQINVTVPKQEVKSETVVVKEVSVQPPSQPGAVISFVEKAGKVVAIVDGKEIEVPNLTGKPTAELGKDGELRITQNVTAKVDVTEMSQALAYRIANEEVQKVREEERKKAMRIENRKTYQTIGWTALGVLTGKLIGGK